MKALEEVNGKIHKIQSISEELIADVVVMRGTGTEYQYSIEVDSTDNDTAIEYLSKQENYKDFTIIEL